MVIVSRYVGTVLLITINLIINKSQFPHSVLYTKNGKVWQKFGNFFLSHFHKHQSL